MYVTQWKPHVLSENYRKTSVYALKEELMASPAPELLRKNQESCKHYVVAAL